MSMIRALATAGFALLTSSAFAETITVCADGCDYTSINAAIDAASDGDVIQLAAETYFEGTTIDLWKPVTLRGIRGKYGELVSVLDGADSHVVLTASSGSRVEELVVQHGYGYLGGGIRLAGTAVAKWCIIRSNTSSGLSGFGAGVYASGDVTLERCRIEGNYVNNAFGGGLFVSEGAATVVWCQFVGNHASRGGGAYTQYADVLFQYCTFEENTAWTSGSAIEDFLGRQELSVCVIRENGFQWSDAYAWCASGESAADECYFFGNTGGAVRGAPSLRSCEFSGNTGLDAEAFVSGSIVIGECSFDRCCSISPIGSVIDMGGNLFDGLPFPACEDCRANIDCSNDAIDAQDLGLLLARWGSADLQCDIDGDGVVSASDLGLLMAAWGPCS